MNITCEKCGGINSLPEGKSSMFCSFCGTNIEYVVKETKKEKKTIKGSDNDIVLAYVRGGSKGRLDLPMSNLQGIKLEGAYLEGANLSGANLENSNLNGANLEGANLCGANLENSNFSGANLKNADLSKACLIKATLNHSDLCNANLSGVKAMTAEFLKSDLTGASLKNADFSATDMRDSKLVEADLTCTDFMGANLFNTNMGKAIIKDANFLRAVVDSTTFTDITIDQLKSFNKKPGSILFEKSNYKDADFTKMDLSRASFKKCNLVGIRIDGSTLIDGFKNASFAESDLSNTDFRNIVIKKGESMGGRGEYSGYLFYNQCVILNCNFENLFLGNSKFFDCELSGSSFENCDLSGTQGGTKFANSKMKNCNFKNATVSSFVSCDLTGSDFRGAKFTQEFTFLDCNLANAQGFKKKGCYLTTACVEAMQLPDDCHELQTLRNFRDGYVSGTLAGRELIKEYYNIAPRIIEAVNSTGNGPGIFMNLYSEISEIVSLIDKNKPAEAYQSYCDMTLRLKKKYLT